MHIKQNPVWTPEIWKKKIEEFEKKQSSNIFSLF